MQVEILWEVVSFDLVWSGWPDQTFFCQNVRNQCLGKVAKFELNISRCTNGTRKASGRSGPPFPPGMGLSRVVCGSSMRSVSVLDTCSRLDRAGRFSSKSKFRKGHSVKCVTFDVKSGYGIYFDITTVLTCWVSIWKPHFSENLSLVAKNRQNLTSMTARSNPKTASESPQIALRTVCRNFKWIK